MTVASICSGCPFERDTQERQELKLCMDQGAWIPCQLTVVPPRDFTVGVRVAAWHHEEECAGAREWRRNRKLPDQRQAA